MELAQQIGLDVKGISFPGHFLMKLTVLLILFLKVDLIQVLTQMVKQLFLQMVQLMQLQIKKLSPLLHNKNNQV